MKENLKHFLNTYKTEIYNTAEALRAEPLPEITEELFSLFERTGNRLRYEDVYFRRREFLAVYGMAVILRESTADIHKLCKVIRGICGELCWALPAHVDRKGNPEGWTTTVDLFASETAFALAEIGALCENLLPEDLLSLMREHILERVILPFERSRVPYGTWENCEHNWNAVCAGSIGCTAIYLFREEPERLQNLLDRVKASLTHYVDGFAGDGACMEGLGYFTYGMSYYTAFAELLERYTKGQTDLMAGEKLRKIMEFQQKCYFPGGLSVSFSDGSSQERFRVGLTCFLARKHRGVRFPNMELAAGLHSDTCYRWAELYRDYVFTKEYLAAMDEKEEEKDRAEYNACQVTLPLAQWTVCRGSLDSAAAAKGGHNGEPHNHNDVGSFHYVVGKECFLSDLGAGEYTKEYFREETRYTIFVNQSLSHNLPIINGHGQLAGKEYACRSFETDGRGRTEIAFEKTYGEKALRACQRTLEFDPQKGSLRVQDEFQMDQPLSVTENLVTPCLPKIEGNRIYLRGNERCCIVEVRSESEIRFQIIPQHYSTHDGSAAAVCLIQWPVTVTDGYGEAVFEITIQ